ncbi:Protein CBR-SAEG-1 [Aphelenchoides fujianensis]|nr:Protein CBR-SAEG-1 [Aphelenchoides fujianensis]
MAAAMAAVMSNPTSSGQSAYPWLHGGGEFPSPASSATSVNNSYSQPPSVGSMAMDLFGNDASAGGPMPRAAAKVGGTSGKKGAQPAADGFFHCRLCDKKFEKVKRRPPPNSNTNSSSSRTNKAASRNPQRNAPNGNDRLPNDALLGFRADIDAQQQLQQQQQQAAFLRLIGAHSAFNTAAVSSAGGLNDALSMGQLTAAQLSAFTQPELSSVLAAMPQQPATTAAALEQLNFQNSATIMH